MRRILVLAIIAIAVACAAQRTTRRGLHAKTDSKESEAPAIKPVYDTIVAPGTDLIEVKGYDKPLRSRRETFFVTNNADKSVEGMAITITYFDRSRRQLHQRPANIRIDIPAGETRQAVLKSWDTQQAFYHINSPVPSRAQQATPYEVKITVDTIFFTR